MRRVILGLAVLTGLAGAAAVVHTVTAFADPPACDTPAC